MHIKRLMRPNGGKRVIPCKTFLPGKFTLRTKNWPNMGQNGKKWLKMAKNHIFLSVIVIQNFFNKSYSI